MSSTGKPLRFVLVAGEASGDAQGARLVEEIRRLEPEARFGGIGGARMGAAGVDLWFNSDAWGSIGIVECLKLVPPLMRIKWKLLPRLAQDPPDLLIPIDFGYFNVRLARFARMNDIRVLYYFPPRSWSRTTYVSPKLRESVSAVSTPFPWSADRFREAGVPVQFVGHPLLDAADRVLGKAHWCHEWGLEADRPLVALLPGSRHHEVAHLWPVLVEAAGLIANGAPGCQFVVPLVPSVDRAFIERELMRYRKGHKDSAGSSSAPFPTIHLLEGQAGPALSAADAAAVCSGTATLEAAIRETPMVVLYRGSWVMGIEYVVRQGRKQIPFMGMPNIIAGREIVREFIQKDASPQHIAEEILSLLQDKDRAGQMRQDLAEVSRSLGSPGAAARTAVLAVALARGEYPIAAATMMQRLQPPPAQPGTESITEPVSATEPGRDTVGFPS